MLCNLIDVRVTPTASWQSEGDNMFQVKLRPARPGNFFLKKF